MHTEEEAVKARDTAKAIFASGDFSNMPEVYIGPDDLKDGLIDIQSLLIKCEMATSRGDARRSIEGGGVSAGGEKVTDIFQSFKSDDLTGGLVIKKGKKNYKKIIFR